MEGLRSARVALLAGLFLCCLPGTRALALDQEERDAAYKRADAGLKRALARASKDEIAYWVEQLGAVGTPRAIERVLAVGERFPGEPVRTSALQALVWSKSDTCLEFYDGELKRTRDPERAILIIEALERIKNPLSVTPLIAALQARDTRVLLSALRALRQKPSPEAVEGCIAFFKKVEETRDLLWAETRITLLALTGEEYGHHQDWEAWWSLRRKEWRPGQRRRKQEAEARTVVYRPQKSWDLPQIFGQEVASKRVVFVIDTSQSMRKEDPYEGEEGGGGGSRVRLRRAKAELIRAVNALRQDVRFNIVAYDTGVTPWQEEELVPATASNKKRAIQFIGSWKADGHTNTLEALLLAMEMEDVDTIILLSDGSPTVPGIGTLSDIPPILDAIKELNRFKLITLHTLGFEGAKVSFMRALADQNGGAYAPIK